LWKLEGGKRESLISENLMPMMSTILRGLAQFLVKQPSPLDKLQNACVPFNFYQFDSSSSPKKQVAALMQVAAKKYSELQSVADATESLIDINDL
jgi:hypothetical protein